MKFKPYPVCKGRTFKREKLEKPICCKKNSIISNDLLDEKTKIKFIGLLFR